MGLSGQDQSSGLEPLSPLEAIRAWIGGAVGQCDRSALSSAIQRDRRIELDDDEIAYLVEDGIESGLDARAVLERLLTASGGGQTLGLASQPET